MAATIYLTYLDRAGKEGRVEVTFPDAGITQASAEQLARALAVLLSPLTYGGLQRAGVTFDLSIEGLSVGYVPNILADVRDKMLLAFKSSGAAGFFPKRMTIPTYDESFTVDGSSAVDLTAPEVDAFIDAMLGGITVAAGTFFPSDAREYDLTLLEYAVEAD